MRIIPAAITDVLLVHPTRHADSRGFFAEVYRKDQLLRAGFDAEFVQDNDSFSEKPWTIRGLHFQAPPRAQAKLIRCAHGSVLDVCVDLRHSSPTFGRHVTAILTAKEGNQILVPEGFAHGFCTLESDTQVVYKVSDYYSPEHDHGLLWNDPALGIPWPVTAEEALLSPRDEQHPRLAELPRYFEYRPVGDQTLVGAK